MQRRSDTAAHTATASAVVAAGNLRLESIPALREAGVRTEHWSTAQQLARRRVLSRLQQALFREALLSADQL
ncbi:hypothetical protein NLR80_26690, partial [Escherichia coli]|nr:hypothetical protein [Escherichia coli]